MIKSFRHKGLAELFERRQTARGRQDLRARCLRRLDALDAAEVLDDLLVPGFDLHALAGRPRRHTIHVNGPFCITFEWVDGHAWRVDLENYH